jgi:DNA-binding transcriptional regulator LsrR (DeoR family)
MASSDRSDNGSGKKRRVIAKNIAKNADLLDRVVLRSFRHRGRPSFCSAREVARDLGLHVPAVIALRDEAFERGLFTPLVYLPQERVDVIRLEAAVRARYGLRKVLLVPGPPEVLEDLDEKARRAVHLGVIRAMHQRLGEHLDAVLAEVAIAQETEAKAGRDVRPYCLGVAWGRNMHLFARHLLSTPRAARPRALYVLPIVGITCTFKADPVEANAVALDVAQAYRGLAGQLACPAFVRAEEVDVVRQFPPVKRMLDLLETCDAVITSMGPIPEDGAAIDITVSNDPAMNDKLSRHARAAGAVGEICYWLFDRDGREVRTTHKGIGLGFDGLRRTAREREVILVCGGDRWRFEPLRAALRAGLASVLVSDTRTARALMDELKTALPAA